MQRSDAPAWHEACLQELDSLQQHDTYDLVDIDQVPPGMKVLDGRWVFKVKTAADGSREPVYKARYVAKGFQQVEGIDFDDRYAPTS